MRAPGDSRVRRPISSTCPPTSAWQRCSASTPLRLKAKSSSRWSVTPWNSSSWWRAARSCRCSPAAWYFLAFHTSDVSQAAGRLERAVVLHAPRMQHPAPAPKLAPWRTANFASASMLAQYASNLVEQGQFRKLRRRLRKDSSFSGTRGSSWDSRLPWRFGPPGGPPGDLPGRACLQEVISLATTF